jgi:type I restriction enzyme S subunit
MNADDNGELPEGWESVLIGETVTANYGKALKSEDRRPGDVPVYGSGGIVGEHSASITSGETIVVGRKGSVGATFFSARGCWPIDTTYFVTEFGPFSSRFLFHLLHWLDLAHLDTSSAIPGLSRSDLYAVNVPLPPLAEQRRIVAAVEAVLAKVNAARDRLNRVPAILKRFRQAVLSAACSGRLTADWREKHPGESAQRILERLKRATGLVKTRRDVPESVEVPDAVGALEMPESWQLASVAELLRSSALVDVKDGNHGANHPKVSDFTADGLPFITAAQVTGFRIDYETAYKLSGSPLEKLRVGFAKPGDAILTHKGSVGRSALNVRECVLTPQTTYYRCHPGALVSGYLVYYFGSLQFYNQLAEVMSQTTRDFVPISEQYRLHLLVPPLAEQQEIVRRVGKLFALADRIEERLTDARRMANQLIQAVLAKAFRGELVPTEAELARREKRTYEPAADLLARIRAERQRETPAPKKRLGRAKL